MGGPGADGELVQFQRAVGAAGGDPDVDDTINTEEGGHIEVRDDEEALSPDGGGEGEALHPRVVEEVVRVEGPGAAVGSGVDIHGELAHVGDVLAVLPTDGHLECEVAVEAGAVGVESNVRVVVVVVAVLSRSEGLRQRTFVIPSGGDERDWHLAPSWAHCWEILSSDVSVGILERVDLHPREGKVQVAEQGQGIGLVGEQVIIVVALSQRIQEDTS